MFDNKSSEFVLVLNCYESYWILVSKKNCKININGSSCIWECSKHTWKVLVPNISGCPGGSDCGLFVLAFAILYVLEQFQRKLHIIKVRLYNTFYVV